ncbi:uncharacterized protein V6R79_020942 [Siganus canaliculatus]
MMAGGAHKGRWDRRVPFGTMLLLVCMVTSSLALLQPPEEQKCPHGDFLTEKGICCHKCSPGFKLTEECHAPGQRTNCTVCPPGQYTDQLNYAPNCRSCKRCKQKHEIEVSPCEADHNTVCRCEDGYYKNKIDSVTYQCRKCLLCEANEKESQTCKEEENRVCECVENYHRVNNKCEPCKACSEQCKHLCTTLTTHNKRAPDSENRSLINIFGAVGGVAVLLLVVVAAVTHAITKWQTKKRLLHLTSIDSSDTCTTVLTQDEDHSNSSDKVVLQVPVTEQEQPSNLPDCVPLEIKIPELIYNVLDLVPVQRMKQLVRSLGVTDTEIEQVQMDYSSCREAHYQMLRVWAERGSRAGGILHWPLLQELLDHLRKMHLGRAAEELETTYGIQ